MRKISLLFLIILIFVSLAHSVLAQGRAVEVEYPEVEGYRPEEVTTPVPKYVQYIFNFAIWISGIIALVVLIIGGFQWFTSAGNLERIKEAKDRISAALLGLVILFSSWLILTTINPELVVFHLPRLRPIISELAPGVLVCREEVKTEVGNDAVLKSWDLVNEYKLSAPTRDREKEIQKELDLLLGKIALDCYYVQTAEDIWSDYDNKVNLIYFIPSLIYKYHEKSQVFYVAGAVPYGAVVYEEDKYKGASKVFYNHLFSPRELIKESISNLAISSIKPFLRPEKDVINWRVTLYEETDFNRGTNLEPFFNMTNLTSVSGDIDTPLSLSKPPKSIRIEGQALAILFMGEKTDVFFEGWDSNLEDNLNIVKQVICTGYQKQTIIKQDCILVGGFGQNISYMPCCAEAAADGIIIISNAKLL